MMNEIQRSPIDWPTIRRVYEASAGRDLSTRQIARDHGVTEAGIRKKAKVEKWLRRDQREHLLSGSRSALGFRIVESPRHTGGRSERASTIGPDDQYDDRARSGVTSVMSEIESARTPTPIARRVRRALPRIKLRKDRNITSEDLVDGLSHVAESLICQIKNAIDHRDMLIKVVEDWDEGVDGKVTAKFAALLKEVDLKKLSAALLNTMIVVKFINDQRSGGAALER
jgi:hypothetical protein